MENVLKDLYEIILDRKNNAEEGSYTSYLFEKGKDKILKKVGEECTEVVISFKNDDKTEKINGICDLAYHVLVLMSEDNVSMEEVEAELEKRRSKIGNFKGERRKVEEI